MAKIRTAWLALLLLGTISAVAAMFTGSWRTPAVAEATPEQTIALADPTEDNSTKLLNWPDAGVRQDASTREIAAREESAARQAVDPDPTLRGAELPSMPFPAAPGTIMNANASATTGANLVNRHWHDANAVTKMPMPSSQQLKKVRDSKAEMRTKRAKAATTAKVCAPPSNALASLFRKLSLAPSCTS